MEAKKIQSSKLDQSLPRRNIKEPDSSTSTDQMLKPRRRVRRKDKKTKSSEPEEQYMSKILTEVERDSVDCEVGTNSQSETQMSLYIDVDLPADSPSQSDSSPALAASLMDTRPPSSSGPGFIRVRSGPSVGSRPAASDPVALHQKYKKQWAKVNIPGEKSHNKLRWAVRGWMMGEEPV